MRGHGLRLVVGAALARVRLRLAHAHFPPAALRFAFVGRVAVEGPRRRELAELVADHVFGDEHRDVLLAVVDAEGQADELRQDRRAARPDLDHLVAARRARGFSAFLSR